MTEQTRQELIEKATEIIDMVEDAIRKEFQVIDEIARKQTDKDGEPCNTLLYGEVYYNLEDEVIETLKRK